MLEESEKARSWGPGLLFGVTDGTRTRDIQDHNLVLYQLNYGHHHRCFTGAVDTSVTLVPGPNPLVEGLNR